MPVGKPIQNISLPDRQSVVSLCAVWLVLSTGSLILSFPGLKPVEASI